MKKSTLSTGTTLKQQFTTAVKAGDLPAQVAVARTAARQLLMHDGLDTEEELQQVQALAGEFTKTDDLNAWEAFCRQLKAAYALGVAIGQLVHPDVFRQGGER